MSPQGQAHRDGSYFDVRWSLSGPSRRAWAARRSSEQTVINVIFHGGRAPGLAAGNGLHHFEKLGRVGDMGGRAMRHPRIHLTALATSAFAACAFAVTPAAAQRHAVGGGIGGGTGGAPRVAPPAAPHLAAPAAPPLAPPVAPPVPSPPPFPPPPGRP